jgi:glutamate/tyrosine decarboxylase-like PLP-dependent enzyme
MKVFENELKGIAPPVIIVPRSKHYSLVKAAELLGIGSTDSLIYVDLKEDFTIDKDALEGILTKCKEEKRVVIAVVGVIGTTEEGAIDDIKEIDELRKHSGISFWLHADAAWGGYLASILWGENEKEINDDKEFVRKFTQVIGPDREVNPKILNGLFKKLKNLSLADSITIDPHKLGYIPYPCGGIVFKDKRIRDVICFHAPYIFHIQRKGGAEFIGRYILEGSKPGASAVACYLSHKVIPLNWSGYGYLMAMTIKAANFINAELKAIKVNGIKVVPVFEPQSNLVNFVVNFENNRSLKTMNTITDRIYKKLSIYLAEEPKAVQLYENLVSKTEFHFEEYGDKPILKLLKEAGIIDETDTKKTLKELRENNKIDDDKVSILRMTCMNPFLLAKKNNEYYYIKKFIETLTKILKKFSLNIFAWEDEEKEYNNLKNMVENIAQEETIYISLSPDKDLKSDDVIERIKKMEDIPDLFIIDLMEKRDPLAGVRVIKAIKSRDELKEVPILIYTKLSTEDFKTIVAPALKRAGWEEDEENKVVTEKNRDKIFREMIKRIYEKGD